MTTQNLRPDDEEIELGDEDIISVSPKVTSGVVPRNGSLETRNLETHPKSSPDQVQKQLTPEQIREILEKIPEHFTFYDTEKGITIKHCYIKKLDAKSGVAEVSSVHGHYEARIKMTDLNRNLQISKTLEKPDRNLTLKSPEEVVRRNPVNIIGDLHGNFDIFRENLLTLGLIRINGEPNDYNSWEWIGGKQKLTFLGDFLVDRNKSGIKICKAIRNLRKQAVRVGGRVDVLAGNHEDMLYAFLMGSTLAGYDLDTKEHHENFAKMAKQQGISVEEVKKMYSNIVINSSREQIYGSHKGQSDGIMEFIEKFSSDIDVLAALKPNDKGEKVEPKDLMKLDKYKKDPTAISTEVLVNMRQSEEGRMILEEMCNFKVVEFLDDNLLVHTELTKGMIMYLTNMGEDLGISVDNINKIYQQGMKAKLLGEGKVPDLFEKIRHTFLDTDNRIVKREKYEEDGKVKERHVKDQAGNFVLKLQDQDFSVLKRMGVNFIWHGHEKYEVGEHVKTMQTNQSDPKEVLTIVGVDFGAGKSEMGTERSVGQISVKDGGIRGPVQIVTGAEQFAEKRLKDAT